MSTAVELEIHNNSNRDMSDVQEMMKSFMPFAQKRIGFNRPPTINFESDDVNAKNALGKTGFYDPAKMSVTVFVDGRHPKDILRSLSHELVHHGQNCRGDFEGATGAGEQGYAQKDPHLREMEREAYEVGNLCFRDWEDNYKQQTNYVQVNVSLNENKQPRSKNMGIYDKKINNLHEGLMERWGYKLTEGEEELEETATGRVKDGERRPEDARKRPMEESDESDEDVVEEADTDKDEDGKEELSEEEMAARAKTVVNISEEEMHKSGLSSEEYLRKAIHEAINRKLKELEKYDG